VQYKAIVFDKDGTLIDFTGTWLPVFRRAALQVAGGDPDLAATLLHEQGYDATRGRFIGGSLLAAGNNHEIAAAWSAQLSTRVEGDHLSRIFQELVAGSATPVPGLRETLAELKRLGLALGVATSDSFAGIQNSLQRFDVLDLFDFLSGYDSGHGVKPNPGMVEAFCEAVAIPAAQTIVVGDNRHDIEMGRNAGAGLCVGVLTGTSTREELEAIADRVFDNISGLLDLFGTANRR